MRLYLDISLIIVSVLLMIVILLQSKGAGLGGLAGGDFSGSGYHVRRGLERFLFNLTIGLSALFFVLTILTVIVS